MADNKKYYYLKLKENFYDSEEMAILQGMEDGYVYSDILMKLYLKSLKSEGRLMFKEHIPYNAEMLATVIKHPVAFVEKALRIFHELGLVEVLDNGAIFMLDIQNFIGKSSTEGDRKRLYRKRIDEEKKSLTLPERQMSDIRPPEIELEIEKELEIDKEINIKEYQPNRDLVDDVGVDDKCDCITKSSGKKCSRKATHKIDGKNFCNQHSKTVLNPNLKKTSKTDFQNIFNSYTTNSELLVALNDYLDMRLMTEKLTLKTIELRLKELDKLGKNDEEKIAIVNQSVRENWKGLFELKEQSKGGFIRGSQKMVRQEAVPDWLINQQPQEHKPPSQDDLDKVEKMKQMQKQILDMQPK